VQPLLPAPNTLTSTDLYQQVLSRSEAFLASFAQAQTTVEEIGARLVGEGETIFVHSYSGTLLGIFRRAWQAGKRFEIYATESRPGGEGRVLVGELLKLGIPCTMMIDIALGSYIRRADKAIVGADSLAADGSVVNKLGTYLLALACREASVPIYAAGCGYKLSLESLRGGEIRLLERPPAEGKIAPPEFADHPNLRVENRFFDLTPARYFTALITERGVISPAAVTMFLDDPLLSQISTNFPA
jgi:translation initiation factor 2B subunit (eIF-2B alpha/beta/delta family)